MSWLYLLINFGSVIVPFLFSFHPRIRFDRHFFSVALAIVATGLFFIAWDAIFTQKGVWGFNSRYLLGYKIFNLPVEEILFFLCIPFACTFTYYSLNKVTWKGRFNQVPFRLNLALAMCFIFIGVLMFSRLYTCYAFLSAGLLLIMNLRRVRTSFYIAYLVLLIPFFIVNGLLTGWGIPGEVVWYNNAENLSVRIGTIPVEDSVYGFALIISNILLFTTIREYQHKTRNIRAAL